MLLNLSSYGLGYLRQYGDRVTNIRGGGGCLYEGDSLKNHYPRGGGGALIREGRSFERGALSRKYGNRYSYSYILIPYLIPTLPLIMSSK